jgi:hypothetical protein
MRQNPTRTARENNDSGVFNVACTAKVDAATIIFRSLTCSGQLALNIYIPKRAKKLSTGALIKNGHSNRKQTPFSFTILPSIRDGLCVYGVQRIRLLSQKHLSKSKCRFREPVLEADSPTKTAPFKASAIETSILSLKLDTTTESYPTLSAFLVMS